jgi:PAS domain S-box-containing protein
LPRGVRRIRANTYTDAPVFVDPGQSRKFLHCQQVVHQGAARLNLQQASNDVLATLSSSENALKSTANECDVLGIAAEVFVGTRRTEDGMAALTLDERGMICDCNSASEKLFGYRRSELVWRHVSMLLPQLTGIDLLEDGRINAELRFRCHIDYRFQVLNRNGERFLGGLWLNDLRNNGSRRLRAIVRPEEPG